MSCFNGLKLTKLGEILLANINGNLNETLTFTSGAVGAGAISDDNEINSLTALKDKWKDLDILSIEKDEDDETIVKLELQFSNVDLQEAKLFREIGIYAKGNNGEPVLFAYSNAGENYDYVPLPKDNPQTFTIQINLKITSNSKIDAIINMAGFVTIGKMVEFLKSKLTQIPTVIELQSRKNLKVGDIVEVLGYYKAGDGAGHKRKISSEDDGSGVKLKNGLWANIVHNGEVNVSWFGAKGDGVTDDTLFIQKAIDTADIINFQDKTYLITVLDEGELAERFCLKLRSNRLMNLNLSTLKINNPNNYTATSLLRLANVNNVIIYKGKLIGDRDSNTNKGEHGHGIRILNSKNIEITGIEITDMFGDGIDIDTRYDSSDISENIIISNSIVRRVRRNGIAVSTASNVTIKNCYISQVYGTAPQSCIDIETNYPDRPSRNIKIIDNTLLNDINQGTDKECLGFVNGNYTEGLVFSGNYTNAITIFNYAKNIIVSNNIFSHSSLDNVYLTFRSLQNAIISNNLIHNISINITHSSNTINNKDISITDNILRRGDRNYKFITINGTDKNNTDKVIIKNNIFDDCFDHAIYVYSDIYDLTIERNKFILSKAASSDSLMVRSYKLKFIGNDILVNKDYNFTLVYYLLNLQANQNIIKDNIITLLENPLDKPIFDTDKKFPSEPGECDIVSNKVISDFEFRAIQMHSNSAPTSALYNDFRNCNLLVFGGNLKYNVGNILKENIATQVEQLNSLYHLEKMKQENVYDDYIAYNDEKFAYDKQQKEIEKQKQLAYEQALKENPNLSYEEFLSIQPTNLNLIEEPQPSKPLQEFMKKYL